MKLVIHNGGRVWGGNEKWLATLAAGLMQRGHEVLVACRAGGAVERELRRRAIPTATRRPRGALDVISAVRFARWLRRQRSDAWLLTSWNRVVWAGWGGRRARVPRVVVRLGIVRAAPRHGPKARAFRRYVDALIVNSREIRAEWVRSAPWFPPDAVRVVFNGIRLLPPPAEEDRLRLRDKFGAGEDTLLIAGVGHLVPRKGFDLLLDAFARIGTANTRLVIVGSGPRASALRAQAAARGVAERVCWLGHRDDVAAVLSACDLFVLSSRNEGMANVMLEAMVGGTPVIATDISGVRDALGEEPGFSSAGWIVPPEDPAAMAAALAEVLGALRSNPAEVERRVAEARARIHARFSVARMVDEAEAVLFGTNVRVTSE